MYRESLEIYKEIDVLEGSMILDYGRKIIENFRTKGVLKRYSTRFQVSAKALGLRVGNVEI